VKIVIVEKSVLPVSLYGGTQRVVWYLGYELSKMGHDVSFLIGAGSECEFAEVIEINPEVPIVDQVHKDADVVHFFHIPPKLEELNVPYMITIEGNGYTGKDLDQNIAFVSENHAKRYNAECFVYNGMNWDDYTKPELDNKREYFHFLAKASWRLKNVRGAIKTIQKTKSEKIHILGGNRLNLKMGFRFTTTPRAKFHGMVGGVVKDKLINGSKGLVFPVTWDEPFGIAITESLFYGCPVFGTPYGSLSELIKEDVGFLTDNSKEMAQALENSDKFSSKRCYEYARDLFNSKVMADVYLEKYNTVMSGKKLNPKPPHRIKEEDATTKPWTN
jgi:glycosyltransferase involved in cell wall biosynthesis